MSDGQEIPEEFPKKEQKVKNMNKEESWPAVLIPYHNEKHTTIVSTLCWGCGAMIEDVVMGEDGWLFCPCGTGIMKVTV